MHSVVQQGRAAHARLVTLAALFLCCLVIGRVRCEDFVQPDTAFTKQAGGTMRDRSGWTPLFKLCMTGGNFAVNILYVFPAADAAVLKAPANLTQWDAPWILLYPESNWQDAFFYIVSVFCPSTPAATPLHLCDAAFRRATVVAASLLQT